MVLSIVSAGYGDHNEGGKVVDVTGRLKAAGKADPKTVRRRGLGWDRGRGNVCCGTGSSSPSKGADANANHHHPQNRAGRSR